MLVEHKQTPQDLKKIKIPPPPRLIMQSTKIGACDLCCSKNGLIALQKTCSHNAYMLFNTIAKSLKLLILF